MISRKEPGQTRQFHQAPGHSHPRKVKRVWPPSGNSCKCSGSSSIKQRGRKRVRTKTKGPREAPNAKPGGLKKESGRKGRAEKGGWKGHANRPAKPTIRPLTRSLLVRRKSRKKVRLRIDCGGKGITGAAGPSKQKGATWLGMRKGTHRTDA